MLKLAIFVPLLCCALFEQATAFRGYPVKANNIQSDLSVKVVAPNELRRFLKENPNALELKPQESNITAQTLDTVNRFFYTYGYRTCEDEIMAIDWMEYRSLYNQNVTSTSYFPRDGNPGGLITFILLQVDASEYKSISVYITDGGIGEYRIGFTISAEDIVEFGWLLNVYGNPE